MKNLSRYFDDFLANSKQARLLLAINVKSFGQRFSASVVTMLSIGCVSAVLLSVLAMSEGMLKTLQNTGLDNTILVMRAGAISELQSVMFPVEVKILANNEHIMRNAQDQAQVSAEMFVNAQVSVRTSAGTVSKNLALRGINLATQKFRPHFILQSGSFFTTGIRQLLVGQALVRKMPELQVGKIVTVGGAQWQISGIFTDNNSVFESELWADIGMLQTDYQRGNSVQTVRLALNNIADLTVLERQWQDDPRLNVKVLSEKQFFAEQGQALTKLVRYLGFPVAIVMAIGATVAALNTMYFAMNSRRKEIAIHKAIGFSPVAILISILGEALLLAFIGSLFGIIPLLLIFDGWTMAAQNATNLSQMMFNFDISWVLMSKAIALALSIGMIGGLLPALQAMRLSVTQAMRD